MIHYIQKAAENFSIHQLEIPSSVTSINANLRTFIAYIDVKDTTDALTRVYLGCDRALMQRIAAIYLFEDTDDEQTLKDLLLEVANMVIGSAKVLAEEENINPFNIMTPHFEKYGAFDISYQASSALDIDGTIMAIAIKDL